MQGTADDGNESGQMVSTGPVFRMTLKLWVNTLLLTKHANALFVLEERTTRP